MTPVEIEFLLHCYAIAEEHPRIHSKFMAGIIVKFTRDDLIKGDADANYAGYKTTSRGDAHVKQLCALDFPEKSEVWRNSHGEIIDADA